MNINELEKRTGITKQNIRFYEKKELLHPARNAVEFTEALFAYADENQLNLVITKEGMYPVFEIDGVEYTADRTYGRFGATIHCSMTHPEEAEAAEIPEKRRRIYRFFANPFFAAALVLLAVAIDRQSIAAALLVGITLVPYFLWVYY